MQKVDASKNAKIMNGDIRLLKKHLANVTATEMWSIALLERVGGAHLRLVGLEPLDYVSVSVTGGQCDARAMVTFPAAHWLVPNCAAW